MTINYNSGGGMMKTMHNIPRTLILIVVATLQHEGYHGDVYSDDGKLSFTF